MSQLMHPAYARGLACLLAILYGIASFGQVAASPSSPPTADALAQQDGVTQNADGALLLAADAPPAPAVYGSFQRFGTALAPVQQQPLFQRIAIDYSASAPQGSAVRLDLRASPDGQRWSQWEIDLAPGALAAFDEPMRYAQYRVTLLSDALAQPSVRGVRLTPQRGSVQLRALAEARPVAPTYKLRATRMGMVGGRTANGHRITKRDHYVSLPSWRSLSSKGGSEYMVRVTYKGRSSVSPVYDVGPWNTRDNYWDEKRERYNDLPRGWPEDHAAYFDGYNKGRAEKGRVSFPTAIDIGDGVWWDDLGIKGDQATVEVTFLWLGSDPEAGAQPAPKAAPAPKPTPPAATPTAVPPAPAEPPAATPDAPAEPPAAPSDAPPASSPAGPSAAPEPQPAAPDSEG